MPYVKEEARPELDKIVAEMAWQGIKANGDLNYILFKYCKYNVEPSYNNYKNFMAELNEAAEEIRRRILAPYEDTKIVENGDV